MSIHPEPCIADSDAFTQVLNAHAAAAWEFEARPGPEDADYLARESAFLCTRTALISIIDAYTATQVSKNPAECRHSEKRRLTREPALQQILRKSL